MACCSKLKNAVADTPMPCVEVTLFPIRGKAFGTYALAILLTKDGAVVASCRHEINMHNRYHWLDELQVLFDGVIYK